MENLETTTLETITLKELAELLKCKSRETAKKFLIEHNVHYITLGNKAGSSIRIPKSELLKVLTKEGVTK